MTEFIPRILDQLVAKAGQLYTLPAVAMKVLDLTNDPQVDTRALKECIENDPALTTKVLRVVNSSLFGLSREVVDLNQSLALLGTKPLKLLVLGFSLPPGLFTGMAGEMLGQYWRHTLTKAVAAREISETVWHLPGDEAFIGGLLQDLGMLVLIQQLGLPYAEFLEKVYAQGGDLLALEAASLGFDHTALTSRLLAHWNLPDSLVQAVLCAPGQRQVEELPLSERPTLGQILQLSEWIARVLADSGSDALDELLVLAERRLGVSAEQFEDLVSTLEEKVQQLAEVLSLRLPEGRDYRDVLVQAHQRLAEVAVEAACDLVRCRRADSSPATGAPPHDSEADWSLTPADRLLLEQARALRDVVSQVVRRDAKPPANQDADRANPALATAKLPAASLAAEAALPRNAVPAAAEADLGLLGQLAGAVTACRQSRCSLSLLLVKLNEPEELVITRGIDGFSALRRFLATACRGLDYPLMTSFPHDEAGFALILPDCDRRLAVQFGNQLIARSRQLTALDKSNQHPTVSISVGVATVALPPKNFPARDLLDAAEHCLYGSHASGGGVVKSIEIY